MTTEELNCIFCKIPVDLNGDFVKLEFNVKGKPYKIHYAHINCLKERFAKQEQANRLLNKTEELLNRVGL